MIRGTVSHFLQNLEPQRRIDLVGTKVVDPVDEVPDSTSTTEGVGLEERANRFLELFTSVLLLLPGCGLASSGLLLLLLLLELLLVLLLLLELELMVLLLELLL
jgi:hypothetical protein